MDYCHTLQAADMDLDGDIDIVAGEMEKSDDPDQLVIFLNDGDGVSWRKQEVTSTGSYSAKAADIDNDGDHDIISNRNFNKPPLEIWMNQLHHGGKAAQRKDN
jgi:hypothetical protein